MLFLISVLVVVMLLASCGKKKDADQPKDADKPAQTEEVQETTEETEEKASFVGSYKLTAMSNEGMKVSVNEESPINMNMVLKEDGTSVITFVESGEEDVEEQTWEETENGTAIINMEIGDPVELIPQEDGTYQVKLSAEDSVLFVFEKID